jgi:hypothetical protein
MSSGQVVGGAAATKIEPAIVGISSRASPMINQGISPAPEVKQEAYCLFLNPEHREFASAATRDALLMASRIAVVSSSV